MGKPDQPRDRLGRWTDGPAAMPSDGDNAKWLAALSPRDNAALNAWTSPIGLFKMMNRQELEGRLPIHKDLPTVEELDAALDRAPKVSGVVYRGGVMANERASALKPGKIIELKTTKSASAAEHVADKFSSENLGNVKFVIAVKDAPAISGYSKAIGEAEVVLRRGTKYVVESNEKIAGVNVVRITQIK